MKACSFAAEGLLKELAAEESDRDGSELAAALRRDSGTEPSVVRCRSGTEPAVFGRAAAARSELPFVLDITDFAEVTYTYEQKNAFYIFLFFL
jgi:hypothetical protein